MRCVCMLSPLLACISRSRPCRGNRSHPNPPCCLLLWLLVLPKPSSWCSNVSWQCTNDFFSMHKSLGTCAKGQASYPSWHYCCYIVMPCPSPILNVARCHDIMFMAHKAISLHKALCPYATLLSQIPHGAKVLPHEALVPHASCQGVNTWLA